MNNKSILDEYRTVIEAMRNEGKSNSEIAREVSSLYNFPTSEKSIRRAFKRWAKKSSASVKLVGNRAEIVTPSIRLVTDPEELMRELGLDPDQWVIPNVIVNRWGDVNDPNYQLKATLQNKKFILDNLIKPAEKVNLTPRVVPKPVAGAEYTGFFASDFHEPFSEPKLVDLFLQWVSEEKPDEGIIGGDLMDFPEQSRHRHKPEWAATAQQCVNSGYNLLVRLRVASKDTNLVFIPGNHDERIRNRVIDFNQDLCTVRPADKHDEPNMRSIWDIRNLLHLDELEISFIDPKGTYEYASYQIGRELAATHGWLVARQSGKSAANHLDELGHSVIHGHTHRLGSHFKTIYNADGTTRLLQAWEAGCMCQLKKGLGYSRAANWQQSFLTYSVNEEGYVHIEPAMFLDGKLYWRDKVYG